MKYSFAFLLVAVSIALLAGCSGDSLTLQRVIPAPSPSATVVAGAYVVTAVQENATTTALVEYGPASNVALYTLPTTRAVNGAGTNPVDFVRDQAGDIYVAFGATAVEELAPAPPHAIVRTIVGFTAPRAIAVDVHSNLYVADYGATSNGGRVSEFTPGSTTATRTIAVNEPLSLAVDAAGNLYVGSGLGNVYRYAPGAETPSTTLTPPSTTCEANEARALAIDSVGTLYVDLYHMSTCSASIIQGVVDVYPPGATTVSRQIENGEPIGPQSIATDVHDDVFAAGYFGAAPPAVQELVSDTKSTPIYFNVNGAAFPSAVALDASGNIYVVDGDVSVYDSGTLGGLTPSFSRLLAGESALLVMQNP